MAIDTEPKRKLPVIITGGAGAIGSEITKGLALKRYQTLVNLTREIRNGITAEQRFVERVRNPIITLGGIEPIPIYADITKEDELRAGIDIIDSHLTSDQTVHYFALAATGLRGVRLSLGRVLVGLQRKINSGLLTVEDLKEATANIGQIVSTDRGRQSAVQTNQVAALLLFDELQKGGRLSSASTVVNLSSSPTDDLIKGRAVNAFYGAIAYGKMGGESALEERSRKLGIRYLKVIAPVVEGTEVGDLLKQLREIVQAAGIETRVPRVSIKQVADAVLAEFSNQLAGRTERIRAVYLGEDGMTYLKRPDWPDPLLPYL